MTLAMAEAKIQRLEADNAYWWGRCLKAEDKIDLAAAEITALEAALEEEKREALRFAFTEKLREAICTIQEGIDNMHALVDAEP